MPCAPGPGGVAAEHRYVPGTPVRCRLDEHPAAAVYPATDTDRCGHRRSHHSIGQRQVMSRLLPNATVYIHDGGHVDLVVNAAEHARVIEAFRRS
jgi:hypothetical protein